MPLTGTSSEIPLVDMLQVGANNKQTCRIVVKSPLGEGALFLEHGELVHAMRGERVGEDAACELLTEPDVSYRIDAGVVARQRTIDRPCMHVVLEAARRADEAADGAPTGPTRPALTAPMRALASRSVGRVIVAGALVGVAIGSFAAAASWILRDEPPAPRTAVASAPPAPTVTPAAIDATDADVAPHPVVAPAPVAPAPSALAPTITVRALVDDRGAVQDARIYRSRIDLAAWEDAALDAVASWRFTPAQEAGVPVAAWVNVPVSFARAAAAPARVVVKGSDTIGGEHGVGAKLAAAFEAANPGAEVAWEGLGSATAFVGLVDGSAEVGASSRPANGKEVAEAARLGVTLTEYVLGYDGIAVIVHPSSPVERLTTEQLADVFTGAIGAWDALGGEARPIRRIGRPSYSGTHAFFKDKVLQDADFAADTRAIEASDEIVAAVAEDRDAIAYVTVGRVTDAVRVVAIAAPGRAAVAPTATAIRDGSYPIYRPLLLYVRGQPGPTVAALLRFCLSPAGQQLVREAGFVLGDVAEDVVASPDGGGDAAPRLALRVTFRAASATLGRDAKGPLWTLAKELRDTEDRVVLIGNADGVGASKGNARLARRRAEAVADYLRRNGVAPARITVDSSGADAPVATNATRAGRDANRRVDVIVVR